MPTIPIKTKEQIRAMREGGKIHAEVMCQIKQKANIGTSTFELDLLTKKLCKKYNVIPSFLGYQGFPGAICASVNDEIVHGIPGKRKLQDGDILKIDLGIFHKGLHTDACQTIAIGRISKQAKKLSRTTKKCLQKAIELCKADNHLGDISHVIQKTAEQQGFSIVRNLTGHGIGEKLHEPPQILNYGKKGKGIILQPGMAFAIEPILTYGSPENITLDDDWAVVTCDGSLSAHFEHTILITENEPEILTLN
jgi:methionyl aminopeptidase